MTNQVAFVVVNWIEIVVIIIYWLKLRKVKRDQLNIKSEYKKITLGWTIFSMLYFIVVQIGAYKDKS